MDLDFYTREEDNTKYIQDVLEISDELSQLIIQIENCLFTQKNQVLGQHNFGINLEELLFTFQRNESEIKNIVLSAIYTYCPLASKYGVNVFVIFQNSQLRDIGFIDIYIQNRKVFGLVI